MADCRLALFYLGSALDSLALSASLLSLGAVDLGHISLSVVRKNRRYCQVAREVMKNKVGKCQLRCVEREEHPGRPNERIGMK